MIHEIKMYGAKCDSCGVQWSDEDSGIVAFTDRSSMHYMLINSFWAEEKGKHYCGNCFGGYDDDDNLIINKGQ